MGDGESRPQEAMLEQNPGEYGLIHHEDESETEGLGESVLPPRGLGAEGTALRLCKKSVAIAKFTMSASRSWRLGTHPYATELCSQEKLYVR